MLGVLAVVVLVVSATVAWNVFSGRERRDRLKGRPDMDLDEFYGAFYATTTVRKAHVEAALAEISQALDVGAPKLRPTDAFAEQLSASKGWEFDDGLAALTAVARERVVRLGGQPADINKVRTVGDYIELLSKVRELEAARASD